MQTTLKLSIAALTIAAGLSACAGKSATDAAKRDDFSRDLQLASSTTMDLAGPKVNPALLTSLETKPQGAPEAATAVRKGAGNRAVRSHTPTVRATPEMDVAAVDDNSEQVTVESDAPVPAPTNEPVAVAPRPSPVPVIVQAGNGSGDYGTSGNGGGIFGPGGGIGGVIIRGGGVDGDHCEIPGRGRGGVMRSPPIYLPYPGAGMPRSGGSIGRGGMGASRGGGSGGVGMGRRGR